jgi:hypothetical protein
MLSSASSVALKLRPRPPCASLGTNNSKSAQVVSLCSGLFLVTVNNRLRSGAETGNTLPEQQISAPAVDDCPCRGVISGRPAAASVGGACYEGFVYATIAATLGFA